MKEKKRSLEYKVRTERKITRKDRTFILFAFILAILTLAGIVYFFITYGNSQTSDIDYNFENDVIINDNDFMVYNSTFNMKNVSTGYSGLYNATYSMTNDSAGSYGEQIEFIDYADTPSGTNISLIESVVEHDKVIRLNDSSGSFGCGLYHQFEYERENGTVEYYFRTNTGQAHYFYLRDSSNNTAIAFRANAGNFEYRESGGSWTTIRSYQANQWYHLRIDFECGTEGYKGLSSETYYVYINGQQYGSYNFRVIGASPVHNLRFGTGTSDLNYLGWYDAIGFTFSKYFQAYGTRTTNYTINENVGLQEVYSNNLEVDKWEFDIEGVNDPVDNGDSNVNGWNERDGGLNRVSTYDGAYRIYSIGDGSKYGINKTDFSITDDIVNVSIEFRKYAGQGFGNDVHFDFTLYSQESNKLVHIRWSLDDDNHTLYYYDGSTYQSICVLKGSQTIHRFDIYLNHNDNFWYMRRFTEGIFNDTHGFDLLDKTDSGLKEIYCILSTYGGALGQIHINHIGVYGNYQSVCSQEFGYVVRNFWSNDMNLERNYLYNITAYGNFSIGVCENTYTIGETSFLTALGFYNYSGINVFSNEYNRNGFINNPTGIFYVNGSNFNITNLYIRGIKFSQQSTEYLIEFSYNNVDINESFFYCINGSDSLFFNLYCNDTNTEYIQATFSVGNGSFISTDRAISFGSIITPNAFGYFRINYSTTSDFFSFSNTLTDIVSTISQNNRIYDFIIIITDDDDDDVLYNSNGYINDIKLLYVANIDVSITTLNIITVMIPLIIILIPTYAIYLKFGKNTVVPVFLLMCIICVISDLIPIWLFFIVAISSALFIFTKRKGEPT